MDLAKLELSAFLIPTPGQFEQEYLAKRCKRLGMAPMEKQERFELKQLNEIKLYNGFPKVDADVNWKKLFRLFDGKWEFGTFTEFAFNVNFLVVCFDDVFDNR